jgi:hypothetical protein
MRISKLNTHMFNFVASIYKGKWVAEKNMTDMINKFPELWWKEVINLLIDMWKKSDMWAKRDEENKKWDEIWKKLKAM